MCSHHTTMILLNAKMHKLRNHEFHGFNHLTLCQSYYLLSCLCQLASHNPHPYQESTDPL